MYDKNNLLSIAVNNGFTELVKILLKDGADVNTDNAWGNTPFLDASHSLELRQLLMDYGANLSAVDDRGNSALHEVASSGHTEIVEYLIAQGADCEVVNRNRISPLEMAAENGYLEIVKIFLNKIKNASFRYSHCVNALFRSLGPNCNIEVMKVLLKVTKTANLLKDGYPLLKFACRHDRVDIVNLLLEYGADPDLADKNGENPITEASEIQSVVKLLFSKGADLSAKKADGTTLLHWATQPEMISWLIEKGVDVNATDNKHQTPLRWLLRNHYRRIERATLLLNAGADPDIPCADGKTPLLHELLESRFDNADIFLNFGARIDIGDKNNKTPLLLAITKQRPGLVYQMVLKGAGFEINGETGKLAMSFAMDKKCISLLRLLIKKGMNVNFQDRYARTPLHWAVENGVNKLAAELLEKGADINLKNNAGETPLFAAVKTSNHELLQLLSAKSAEVNVSNINGDTPVTLAISRGDKKVLENLIKNGATIDTINNRGESPCSLAFELGDEAILNLLSKAGADFNAFKIPGKPRPAAKEIYYHRILVQYFNSQPHFFDDLEKELPNKRKCIELPWQQTAAEMWDSVTHTLSDLWFLESKIRADLLQDLIKDYFRVLDCLPGQEQENKLKKKSRKERELWCRELIQYSNTTFHSYPEMHSKGPLKEENLLILFHEDNTNQTNGIVINSFFNFVRENFIHFSTLNHRHMVINLALNHGSIGIVHDSAQALVLKHPEIAFFKTCSKNSELPSSLVVNRINGATGCALSADSSTLVYLTEEYNGRYIHIREIDKYNDSKSRREKDVRNIKLTLDNKYIVGVYFDSINIIDTSNLKELRKLPIIRMIKLNNIEYNNGNPRTDIK